MNELKIEHDGSVTTIVTDWLPHKGKCCKGNYTGTYKDGVIYLACDCGVEHVIETEPNLQEVEKSSKCSQNFAEICIEE